MKNHLGLTNHHVFGEWQFTAMQADVALVFEDPGGRRDWLPWIGPDGHVGKDAYGRFWSFWWLTSLPGRPDAATRWARVSESWARHHGVRLDGARVVVKYKPVISGKFWQRDRHASMERLAWTDLAEITWTDGKAKIATLPRAEGQRPSP